MLTTNITKFIASVRRLLPPKVFACVVLSVQRIVSDKISVLQSNSVSEGTVPVNMTIPDLSELEALAASSTSAGGEWQPSNCIANQKVAIIIPYRDREQHFRIFMRHMIPILRRQLVYYRIFLVEQVGDDS